MKTEESHFQIGGQDRGLLCMDDMSQRQDLNPYIFAETPYFFLFFYT